MEYQNIVELFVIGERIFQVCIHTYVYMYVYTSNVKNLFYNQIVY